MFYCYVVEPSTGIVAGKVTQIVALLNAATSKDYRGNTGVGCKDAALI